VQPRGFFYRYTAAMSKRPKVIIGLGNPGPGHAMDRHNAGFWFVDQIASAAGVPFRGEQKLLGEACRVSIQGDNVRLVKPTTFMNRSGQCMRRVIDYYKLSVEDVLVVHDELDLPPGAARLKSGGGHGGNNGLRDIIAHCGREFLRLRIGVGRPGERNRVADYLLRSPPARERDEILAALDASHRALHDLFAHGLERAMNYLHAATPEQAAPG